MTYELQRQAALKEQRDRIRSNSKKLLHVTFTSDVYTMRVSIVKSALDDLSNFTTSAISKLWQDSNLVANDRNLDEVCDMFYDIIAPLYPGKEIHIDITKKVHDTEYGCSSQYPVFKPLHQLKI